VAQNINSYTTDVITPPPIVRLLRNLAGRYKRTCWWLYIRQNRNRK